ncbi:hypothetical protein N7491_009912 [Penicillium cf. griseofulvum]|uniref:Uncharacterized protein n=1 Tax=Penicillium cf. griseofulvum TaxID=2972120 RepID=A0A9W9MZG5_9EURO|nr:hypothetical protein N7472_000238 [Penicillium cf. griseofulvum]KAJ5421467.1 hypothetical protein N7491_009912 [Penicillium cf. griseofulvum]
MSMDVVENLWQNGATKVKEGQLLRTLSMIAGSILGKGGLANYSMTKWLWNEILWLPQEDFDGFVREYLAGGTLFDQETGGKRSSSNAALFLA